MNISKSTLLVKCNNNSDSEILHNELKKLNISEELPKRKLPTLLLKFTSNDIVDSQIKYIITQQNNLTQIPEPVLNARFTLTKFRDSRHVVVKVNPTLRRVLLAPSGIKLNWNICRTEDFVAVTSCIKYLEFGHTSKYYNQDEQSCSNCADQICKHVTPVEAVSSAPETEQWKHCRAKLDIRAKTRSLGVLSSFLGIPSRNMK
ncbi:hypothetical protein C0J52_18763 [Blattella germanica]|nr:hypothetical protein C0J52_18763 [Blattella germanica]